MHRNTGAVHLTVNIKIIDDDFEEPSAFDSIIQHLDILSDWVPSLAGIGKVIAKSVIKRAGKIVAKEIAKVIAKKVAVEIAKNTVKFFGKEFMKELFNKPGSHRELRSLGWYAGKDHILSVWGGFDVPLSMYSCRNQKYYYPEKIYDYVFETNICAKVDVDRSGGKYDL